MTIDRWCGPHNTIACAWYSYTVLGPKCIVRNSFAIAPSTNVLPTSIIGESERTERPAG